MKKIILIAILSLAPIFANAQKFTVATNALDWANYGTINADLGFAVSQHVSLVLGGKYNPWDFSKPDQAIYNKNVVGYFGMRYWPWYVNSGLWFQLKGQYADYENTGVWRHAVDKGKAAGAGLAVGYTFMIAKHFNIELAAGGWGGYLIEHNVWEDSSLKRLREKDSGPRGFIDLDNIAVSFVFVF